MMAACSLLRNYRWLSLDHTDDKSTLVQIMVWHRHAQSHCQFWLRFMSPHGVIRPQWITKWYRKMALLVTGPVLHGRRSFYDITFNVRGPSLNRSISWLLMPWLLASPGHQQPWYWLCIVGESWSYTRKGFSHLWHVSAEEWHKM